MEEDRSLFHDPDRDEFNPAPGQQTGGIVRSRHTPPGGTKATTDQPGFNRDRNRRPDGSSVEIIAGLQSPAIHLVDVARDETAGRLIDPLREYEVHGLRETTQLRVRIREPDTPHLRGNSRRRWRHYRRRSWRRRRDGRRCDG